MQHTINRRRWAALALLAALVLGSVSDCDREGGMYQGGKDSAPGWRKS